MLIFKKIPYAGLVYLSFGKKKNKKQKLGQNMPEAAVLTSKL